MEIRVSSASTCRPGLALVGCALGFVIVLLDVSVVNVALANLRAEFSTNISSLTWVVNAYTIVFGALLLLGGVAGDRFGARRMFLAGFVLFTIASVGCGLAPTLLALLTMRTVQGAGAALLVPNSLVLIQQAYPLPQARGRAIGWWGAAGGIALAVGPVAGGFLIEHFGWRSIFLLNLPIGLMGLLLTRRYAAASPSNPLRSLDLGGQALAMLALAALTMALTEAAKFGWTSPRTAIWIAIGVIAAGFFVAVESTSKSPMLPLNLFRSRGFTSACISGALLNFAYYGLIFVFSLFFQGQRSYSPQETGLAFLPLTVVLMAGSIIGGHLIDKAGARLLMVVGQSLSATGYLAILVALGSGSYARLVLPMLMAAAGMAVTVPTMTNLTLSAVHASSAGLASGVFNTARQVGGMLGVAVCGYLVRDAAAPAFLRGMRMSLLVAFALLAGGALLSFMSLESRRRAGKHVGTGCPTRERV